MAKIKLSKEMALEIDKSLRELHDVLPELDHLEKCGEDCTERRAKVERLRQRLEMQRDRYGR